MEFLYTTPPDGMTDLIVLEVGTQQCAPDSRFGPAVRDMFVLHCVHAGYGHFESGGIVRRVGPGELFLVAKDTVNTFWADPAMPWHYSWFGFGGALAARLCEQAGLSERSPVKRFDPERPVDALFRDLTKLRDEPAKELLLTGLLFRVFGHLAEPDDAAAMKDDVGFHVRKAVAYMNARYAERIRLQDIAAHVGLDEKYLCRLFQAKLRMSPYRFLTDVRMRKACRLLRRHMLGVAEVARSVGYQDPLLFSRMFKRTVGLSPTQYREKAKSESAP
ncbi:AraC family transcriptional regulator [Paenibacillus antri]|uniref:AraC family transcriptional regulator n=1 Tax=Paenibacillus antri TaxID=2582848 RepID=A0A5R9GAM0_9BACL|nr:AraC family transcriptional regulator [Paenibacillus antri]TLS51140.1 AraC family transcriptional regulator [Paenibacillus antri]